MSHDRKPGRVRVMQAGGAASRSPRHDGPAVIIDAASVARARKSARRGQVLLIALFLLAAIGCSVAIEMYLPS